MTVNGAVDPSTLDVTLCHEHVLVDLRHSLSKFDAILDGQRARTEPTTLSPKWATCPASVDIW